eukprot:PhF_6_TR40343/c0_g1_i1/m.60003
MNKSRILPSSGDGDDLRIEYEKLKHMSEQREKRFKDSLAALEAKCETLEAQNKKLLEANQAPSDSSRAVISGFFQQKLDQVVQVMRFFDVDLFELVQNFAEHVGEKDSRDNEYDKLKRSVVDLKTQRAREAEENRSFNQGGSRSIIYDSRKSTMNPSGYRPSKATVPIIKDSNNASGSSIHQSLSLHQVPSGGYTPRKPSRMSFAMSRPQSGRFAASQAQTPDELPSLHKQHSTLSRKNSEHQSRVTAASLGNMGKEVEMLRGENVRLKAKVADAESRANKAKADLHRLVMHNLMTSAKPKQSTDRSNSPSNMSPRAQGGRLPVVQFPPESTGAEGTNLPMFPEVSSIQHKLHIQKYAQQVAARTELVKMMQASYSKSNESMRKAQKMTTPTTVEQQPDQDPTPATPQTCDSLRLVVTAFCADIHILIQRFSEMKSIIQDEQDRLMRVFMSSVGLCSAPSAAPNDVYTEMCKFDITNLRPLFAYDKAAEILSMHEGFHEEWKNDLELMKSSWNGLSSYLDQHLRSQMRYLGSFLQTMETVALDATSTRHHPEQLAMSASSGISSIMKPIAVTHTETDPISRLGSP